VTPPATSGGNYRLRVGNIGDSRVLLGRADGTIFPGPGTDSGLTTDHKPDLDSERERIERTGGTVQSVMGVSRVNGDLAVSRAFGDAQHKESGGPNPEDHPVSAAPELKEFECGPTDFLMLVCDGISEGSFPNGEVIKYAAEWLKPPKDGSPIDPAKAACAVCHEALRQGSKDNLSCMIVLLGGGEVSGKTADFLPGPCDALETGNWRKAYSAMAEHAGLDIPASLERRYSMVQRYIEILEKPGVTPEDLRELYGEGIELVSLKSELAAFQPGPPEDLAAGSEERVKWFADWFEKAQAAGGEDAERNMLDHNSLRDMLESNPRFMQMAEEQGLLQRNEPMSERRVRVSDDATQLKAAIDTHQALKWDDRLADACGTIGVIIREDPSDSTSQVRFPPPLGFKAWLPVSMLVPVRKVKVASQAELQKAVEAHPGLKWDDRLLQVVEKEGWVEDEDEADGTLKVSFEVNATPQAAQAHVFRAWFPVSTLTDVEDEQRSQSMG